MKTRWITTFIALSLIFSGCNGQDVKDENNTNNTDSLALNEAQPNENIVVNKEYDENGNLIRYDSTYTYFYSNIEGNKVLEDSIFSNFRSMFESTYPFSRSPLFDHLFFEDSLLQYDFYKNDFFYERFKQNTRRMEQLFMEMDSLKNNFFENQFPKKPIKKV